MVGPPAEVGLKSVVEMRSVGRSGRCKEGFCGIHGTCWWGLHWSDLHQLEGRLRLT